MKILTLNTHSLREENYQQKLEWFVEGILRERPDIIALQEVNQTTSAGDMAPEMLEGQYPFPAVSVSGRTTMRRRWRTGSGRRASTAVGPGCPSSGATAFMTRALLS